MSRESHPQIRKTAFNASPAMLLNKFCSFKFRSQAFLKMSPVAFSSSILLAEKRRKKIFLEILREIEYLFSLKFHFP